VLPHVRVTMARHPGGDVVVDLPPSDVAKHVRAIPCSACNGARLTPESERCTACHATGLELPWVQPADEASHG
jgi:hypothetical protein